MKEADRAGFELLLCRLVAFNVDSTVDLSCVDPVRMSATQLRLVGLEACGSAHHWARELIRLGHDARLMPPAYVKPYVRRQKKDSADAAAICEGVTRPSMRFVPIRSVENQAMLMRHKVRELLVAQRTQLINALRGHLAEIGVIAAQGPTNAHDLAELIEEGDEAIAAAVRAALKPVVRQLNILDAESLKATEPSRKYRERTRSHVAR